MAGSWGGFGTKKAQYYHREDTGYIITMYTYIAYRI